MKFISSREIRSNPARLWELPINDEAVITVNGKPRAIVLAVGDDLVETLFTMRRARISAAVEKIRITSWEKGLENLSEQEIEAEISHSRKRR
jgi:hypothetical protein